ncbi:hypothetical protein [Pleomorphomonas koreensis]|uniref:hypothetical protein n=1 Tax=Pleomorphomonas koreensis TaxID=257440 RepID=UPI00040E86FC|nr:hypothetical protein [Pleomorphomonas koreensis]
MQSRGVASHQTSIGSVTRKKGAASAARRRRRGGGHQDARSFLIAGFLVLVVAVVVAAIWFNTRPFPIAAATGPRPPPSAADLEAKKTHSYWKVGSNTYRHYITNASTGEIVDAGTMTVREMLDQGIEVPGYSLPAKGGVTGSDELAIRFRALQDHLK